MRGVWCVQKTGSVLASSMKIAESQERTSWHSVDCSGRSPPGASPKPTRSSTAQATLCESVTRATAAKPMPIDSQSTFSRRGTASMRAMAAMSWAMACDGWSDDTVRKAAALRWTRL